MENKIPKILRDAGYEMNCDVEKLNTQGIPVTSVEIKELVWIFDLPLWGKDGESWNLTPWDIINRVPGSESQRKRVENVDLNFPILVYRKNNRWIVVDGVHRLVKMYLEDKSIVSAKVLSEGMLKECHGK